mmetsp:Transcript_10303/g.41942  ORF Transcript_10303/g.41942 Transcript_10303/m.41942 type:complete len:209 (-) Transcript_10303:1543-2169(-)
MAGVRLLQAAGARLHHHLLAHDHGEHHGHQRVHGGGHCARGRRRHHAGGAQPRGGGGPAAGAAVPARARAARPPLPPLQARAGGDGGQVPRSGAALRRAPPLREDLHPGGHLPDALPHDAGPAQVQRPPHAGPRLRHRAPLLPRRLLQGGLPPAAQRHRREAHARRPRVPPVHLGAPSRGDPPHPPLEPAADRAHQHLRSAPEGAAHP